MRRWGVLSLVLAGCSASGSDNTTHGPVYDDEDAGTEAGALVDATVAGDSAADGSAAADVNVAASEDATVTDSQAPDANVPVDAGADAPADVANDAQTCASTTALLAGSATSLAGAWVVGTTPSSLQTVTGSLGSAPAIVPLGGVFQTLAEEGSQALASSSTSGSAWSSLAPLTGNPASSGAPSMAALGTALHAAYLGTNDRYYHATFNGTSWDSASDPIGPNPDAAGQAFGSVPPSAASVGSTFVVAYQGSNNLVYVQSWTSAAGWDDGVQVGTDTVAMNEPVVLVALAGGTHDLLVVYENGADTKLYAVARDATTKTWAATSTLVNTNAFTHDPPTLTAMSGARAMLAWHGTDGAAYTSAYADATGAWTAPAPLVAGTNPTVTSAPSLAPGVCGDDAVAAFVSGGAVSVVRSSGGAWLTPTSVSGGSGATSVTIATSP